MNHPFTPELIEKVKAAQSAAELLALAEENKIELTEEQAAECYTRLNSQSGALADEELDNVAGGGCSSGDGRLLVTSAYRCDYWNCVYCGVPVASHNTCISKRHTEVLTCSGGKQFSCSCANCGHCSYENALLLCNHPANRR